MKSMWNDPGVRMAVSRSRNLPFHDSMLYFYKSLGRTSSPRWLPDDQDIL
ncbi:Guanine nucleotide-binding protein alpha-2 subunit [Penicillium chrysogenum]|nr:Guanine nucleotide-binding protein alpha-2 subunit [Penicillium chrysogenum]KAJ6167993.1 Guanine nucleotide-binding protein alpha-2 subunit [Penicillium chrysogenum]